MRCPDIDTQAFLDGEATAHWMFCSANLSDSFYDVVDWNVEYSKERYLEVVGEFERIYLRRAKVEAEKPHRVTIED